MTDHKVEIGSDEAIVEASVSGADHNAVVTLIINDQGSLSSITVNVERSMGELMLNAALNTLGWYGNGIYYPDSDQLVNRLLQVYPQIQGKVFQEEQTACCFLQRHRLLRAC